MLRGLGFLEDRDINAELVFADRVEYQVSNSLLILSRMELIEELMLGPSQFSSQFD